MPKKGSTEVIIKASPRKSVENYEGTPSLAGRAAFKDIGGTQSIRPSDLVRLANEWGLVPLSKVAVDTETSGLFVDDGARVSTVSVAFFDDDGWFDFVSDFDGEAQEDCVYHRTFEPIDDEVSRWVVSFAWPFDQGAFGTDKPEGMAQQAMWDDAQNLDQREWVWLLDWLELVGKRTGHVYHHAKFDLHMMEAGVRRWPGVGRDFSPVTVADTQNGCSLLYPTNVVIMTNTGPKTSTSLKPNAAFFWGGGETDEQKVVKEYLRKNKLPAGRWDLIPWDIIKRYAEHDANLTLRLDARQELDMDNLRAGDWLPNPRALLRRRLETSFMLYRTERRGLPFDHKGAKAVAKHLEQVKAELEEQLPFEPATLPAAKKFWFETLNIEPYETTPGGAPSVTDMTIKKMIKDEVEGAETWASIQKVGTAIDRWYLGWSSMAGSDGRLRCSVRQNGTVSSRFSVERVQLQAIPHDYKLAGFKELEGVPTPRKLIGQGVPEGWKLWELDLAQAELRVAALYAKCQTMLDLIDAGADLHGETAKMLFKIDEQDHRWGERRQVAKRANFGLIFGSGWETFQADLEKQTGIRLSDAEAQVLVRDWNNVYPEFKRAIYKTKDTVERRMKEGQYGEGIGWTQTTNGERRWFVAGEDTHKAFNQRVQPNLAQFGLDWWLWSEKYLMERLGDGVVQTTGQFVGRVGMVMMVHDSQILLLPDNPTSLEWIAVIQQKARDLWKERFPGVPGDVDAKEWGKS